MGRVMGGWVAMGRAVGRAMGRVGTGQQLCQAHLRRGVAMRTACPDRHSSPPTRSASLHSLPSLSPLPPPHKRPTNVMPQVELKGSEEAMKVATAMSLTAVNRGAPQRIVVQQPGAWLGLAAGDGTGCLVGLLTAQMG